MKTTVLRDGPGTVKDEQRRKRLHRALDAVMDRKVADAGVPSVKCATCGKTVRLYKDGDDFALTSHDDKSGEECPGTNTLIKRAWVAGPAKDANPDPTIEAYFKEIKRSYKSMSVLMDMLREKFGEAKLKQWQADKKEFGARTDPAKFMGGSDASGAAVVKRGVFGKGNKYRILADSDDDTYSVFIDGGSMGECRYNGFKSLRAAEAELKDSIKLDEKLSRGKDSSNNPFDRDTDAGSAKIVKREAAAGMSAKEIAKKYGFSLSFVEEEMPKKGSAKDVAQSQKEWRQKVKAEYPTVKFEVLHAAGEVAAWVGKVEVDWYNLDDEAKPLSSKKATDELQPVGAHTDNEELCANCGFMYGEHSMKNECPAKQQGKGFRSDSKWKPSGKYPK